MENEKAGLHWQADVTNKNIRIIENTIQSISNTKRATTDLTAAQDDDYANAIYHCNEAIESLQKIIKR